MKIDLDRLHYDFLIPGYKKTSSNLIEAIQNLYFVDCIYIITPMNNIHFIRGKILEIIKDNYQLGFQILKLKNSYTIELIYENKIKCIKLSQNDRGITFTKFYIS
jgi:hypothetical protein